jgi:hypothetical protein
LDEVILLGKLFRIILQLRHFMQHTTLRQNPECLLNEQVLRNHEGWLNRSLKRRMESAVPKGDLVTTHRWMWVMVHMVLHLI